MVDFRSAIARNWIAYFLGRQHEVHVISTYPVATPPAGLASFHEVLVGFASMASEQVRRYVSVTGVPNARSGEPGTAVSRIAPAVNAIARWVFPWVMPADAWRRRVEARAIIDRISPDLVHAMRIPAEGMLAAHALEDRAMPLIVSVWGNDFTLYANENPLIGSATRRTMHRATALHSDCYRDLHLSRYWGFDAAKPSVVLPGSGGVQLDLFRPKPAPDAVYGQWGLDAKRPIIFNPRNFRPKYVLNDVFFEAAEGVLEKRPDTQFVCVGMAGNPVAEQWRAGLRNTSSARLLPAVSRSQMAELFQIADISVSPSIHDGTPNTLLEAMACGAFPVAGDIESVREWITTGVNGTLCDPSNRHALEKALLDALEDTGMRARAATHNRRVIEERADYEKVMPAAEAFYNTLAPAREGARALRTPRTSDPSEPIRA